LKKADVNVEVRGNDICISGERKSESEQREGQYYRSERSYGSFFRSVPLPEGAKPDTASATFENGVLKIEMEAGEDGGAQPRRIEVREGSPH
jgi:HSP20 family protein